MLRHYLFKAARINGLIVGSGVVLATVFWGKASEAYIYCMFALALIGTANMFIGLIAMISALLEVNNLRIGFAMMIVGALMLAGAWLWLLQI